MPHLKHYNRSLRYFPNEAARIVIHKRPGLWVRIAARLCGVSPYQY